MPQRPPKISHQVKDSVTFAIKKRYNKVLGLKGNEGHKEIELIRQRWFRDLTTPEFLEAVTQAAQQNDMDFFRKLEKVLNQKPIPVPTPFPEQTDIFTLESALIRLWLPGEQPSAGFCQMSDPLIADCLNTLFNRATSNTLLPDTVRKAWERLGLKKSKRKLLTRKSELPSGPTDLPPWDPDDLIRPPQQTVPRLQTKNAKKFGQSK